MESDLPSLWVQRGGASGAVRRERPQSWAPSREAHTRRILLPLECFLFFFFLRTFIYAFDCATRILLRADSQLQPAGSSSLT